MAAGTTVAGVDVGGLSEKEALGCSPRRRQRSTRCRSPSRRVVSRSRFPRPSSESLPTGTPPSRTPLRPEEASRPSVGTSGSWVASSGSMRHRRSAPTTRPSAYKLDQIARAVDRKGVDAKVVLKGLDVQIVEGQPGRNLDRAAATAVVVQALASLRARHTGRASAHVDRPAGCRLRSRRRRRRRRGSPCRRPCDSPTVRRAGGSHDGR